MNITQLFQQLQQAGVRASQQHDKITLQLPKDLDADLTQALREHREALKHYLTQLFHAGAEKPALTPAAPDQRQLSFAQQRLWLIDQLQGSSAEYNMPQLYQVSGDFDLDRANAAFSQIISRHQILRTVYLAGADGPQQQVQPEQPFRIRLLDLSAFAPAAQQDALQQQVRADTELPFDLTADLMIRVSYLQTGPAHGYLLLNMHHIASDGWSMQLLAQEFITLYSMLATGADFRLPPLPLQYNDYAQWQRQWLTPGRLEAQQHYWRRQLADLPLLHGLNPTLSRPAQKQYQGALLQAQLDATVAGRLQQLARRLQLTPFMLLHAALSLVPMISSPARRWPTAPKRRCKG